MQVYLADEFPGDAAAQTTALAVYDNPPVEGRIAEARLRAAFAALRGAFADAAIDFFLNAKTSAGNPLFASASFGSPGVAAVVANPRSSGPYWARRGRRRITDRRLPGGS